MKKFVSFSIFVVVLASLWFTSTPNLTKAIGTPFVPTNTPVTPAPTNTPTPTIFLTPWHSPTPTQTATRTPTPIKCFEQKGQICPPRVP